MIEILEEANALGYTLPTDSAGALTVMKDGLDQLTTESGVLVAEHNLIYKILSTALMVENDQSPILKPPVKVCPTEQIILSPNCTDTAATQLFVCGAIGLMSLAVFDGRHASVVVRGRTEGYWNIPSRVAPFVQNIRTEQQQEKARGGVINNMLGKLDDSSGALMWNQRNDCNENWGFELLKGENIRQETRLIRSAQKAGSFNSAFVVVKPPLAYSMLRAVDILEALRPNPANALTRTEQRVVAYSSAKQALKYLVPDLRTK